jgi:sulfite dehydrogenase (cytochrome) subunit B
MSAMNCLKIATLVLVAPAVAAAAGTDERSLQLRDAPEAVTVLAGCSGCHSVDYIEMNSPFLNRSGWEAEVRKMMKAYGAPIREDDVGPIVSYLTRYYGVD